MPSATVKSSTINLSNTILGAGMLAMPSAIAATGLVFGAFLIVFSACCSGFGLYLLSRCAATLHSRDASFYRVAQRTYPGAATVIDLAIAIKCFGVGVSYLIIIGDLMPQVMDPLLGGGSFAWLNDRRLWITLAMVLVVAPLSFLKRLDSLRHTSLAALMAVVYLFLLVVGSYWSPESIPPNTDLPPRPNPHSLPWFKFSTDFFTKLPIFVFAFTCHQNIFTVYNELVDNSQRYVNQVIRYSMMAGLFIYEFIGLSGYLSFGNRVLPNIILMYKPSILVTGGQAALVILQIFSYPLQCHPCRASLDKVIPYSIAHNSTENEHEDILPVLLPPGTSSEHRFRLLTIAILIASYILAITVNKLDLVLSLVGATGSTTISFILPGLFYWRITGLQDDSATTVTLSRKERLLRWMAGGLAVYGICVLCICVSFTLKRAIYN
ncbi:transmembrane amino acid transporter protein-domain-containing protein [Syncephalis fuscata]|nr:transmembrane amino acid transporter protein-domain-containing protein [Syncephalis fuscata]